MKKSYYRAIAILFLTLSFTVYLVLAYQNHEEAKTFNAWYDSFLESSRENVPEREERDLSIVLQKSEEAARYVSEVLIAEIEDVERIGALSVLTLRARSDLRQKMARDAYVVSYIGNAFIEYKSSHCEHRTAFEIDHGITEWKEEDWNAFLVYLEEILPTVSEIEEMVPSEEKLRENVSKERDRKILRGFYERSVERYTATMENARSDKALFEYELLKVLNDEMFRETFFPLMNIEEMGYLFLIKDSAEFIVPVSLLIWIGYLIGYALPKWKDTFASMEKKRRVTVIALITTLLIFLVLSSSLTAFLLFNDKRLLVIRSSALRDTEPVGRSSETVWETVEFWRVDGIIETGDIAALESVFNEILSEERYVENEESFRADAIDAIKRKEPYPVFPYFSTIWKVGGVYIVIIPKEFLSVSKEELSEDIERIRRELESEKDEIITLCEEGKIEQAKEQWMYFQWKIGWYEGMKEGYMHAKVLEELALFIL